VLVAGYIGYGALSADIGLSLWATLLSTIAIWALPGQLILVEMSSSGAPLVAILLAVSFSAVRFLPMTGSLLPARRAPAHGRIKEFLAAHLIAMTGWVIAMRRAPELPVPDRLPYFIGFALALWLVSIAATGAGYLVAGALPPVTKAAFVFMNPVYFLLLMIGDARTRIMVLSLAGGAVFGPLIYLLAPQWSVLGGGLVGGTAAFAIHRATLRHD
jgi:predicted branched-subunit amino acid permease